MSNGFSMMLSQLRGGLIQTDLSHKLADLVTACQASGKKGSITLTITLDPKGSENREMNVTAKVATKTPPGPDLDERTIFYAQRGQLLRNDPNQQNLGFRSVDSDRADGGSPADERATG